MVKWPDTDMYFIHPSSPAPLYPAHGEHDGYVMTDASLRDRSIITGPIPLGAEAGSHHEARMLGCMGNCAQGDRECDPECAEIRSAQAGGKRMTDQEVGEAWGNAVGWPFAAVVVIAVVAAVWHVVARAL